MVGVKMPRRLLERVERAVAKLNRGPPKSAPPWSVSSFVRNAILEYVQRVEEGR